MKIKEKEKLVMLVLLIFSISIIPINHLWAEQAYDIYIVKEGDELHEIAERYGIDYKELGEINGLDNLDLIYVGQELKVPILNQEVPSISETSKIYDNGPQIVPLIPWPVQGKTGIIYDEQAIINKLINSNKNDYGIKLYVLDGGTLNLPENSVYQDGSKDVMLSVPVYAVLIDHPDALILFDSGMSDDWVNYPADAFAKANYKRSERGTIPDQIISLGYKLEDVDYVVQSHLHSDHQGYYELFPNAQVLVQREEFNGTARVFFSGKHNQPNEVILRAQKPIKWLEIAGDTDQTILEWLPGINLILTEYNHTFGMISMMVDLYHYGRVLLVSDLIYTESCVFPTYKYAAKYTKFPDGMREDLDWLLPIANKIGAKIWYGHDRDQYSTIKKWWNGYYN
ncbi:hypothetical membrane protein [Pelotomaculum thermopropionicum SI]|uniref:Hypothetical membrane protein n=1 Tax=Pelotomaculum thermopropionicum (strain DSM 13744 / JCM 10971 / SI) TaxID=370438 RepID=A5CZI5_PELTS|nr:hypothetical membrane protein [Pelotomaculum thermopropionicum SI]